jgi:type II secretory pathway pseudopilin PulG
VGGHPSQRGVALVILVVILAIVMVAFMLAASPTAGTATEQEQQTIHALNTAREALIAYAVSVPPRSPPPPAAPLAPESMRPGNLPCPDLDGDGIAEDPPCSLPSQRIGRLPVQTLGLQGLVDGHGESLWYALSGTFAQSTGNQCPAPGGLNCLNSETGGTITVRASNGTITNDGTTVPGAAIAVIFSPGPAIARQDGITQDRGSRPARSPESAATSSARRRAAIPSIIWMW